MTTDTTQNNAETPQQTEEAKQNNKEYNFAQLRKAREQAELQTEQERQARIKAEQELESLRKTRSSIPEGENDDFDDDSEPYIDKKSLRKHLKRTKAEASREITQEIEQKVQNAVAEERRRTEDLRLKVDCPDFNEVLNEENAQRLFEKKKILAETIAQIPDEALRKRMAYQAIKELGLHKKEEPKSTIQEQINKNQKPLYYTPSGMAGPSGNPVDFSEAGQKKAWEMMQSKIKSRRAL